MTDDGLLFEAETAPAESEWDGPGDCPLPDLCRRLRADHPSLTIGQFHDGLRELHDREQVYLHPWTGPLYALPEPAFALMVGHEVAYYASERQPAATEYFTNGAQPVTV